MADFRGTRRNSVPGSASRLLASEEFLGFLSVGHVEAEPLYRGPPPARRAASHTRRSRHSKCASLFHG